jgi:hypothetical protein
MDLAPLNLGMVAAYYYIAYTTIEIFASSLNAKTKMKGLLEIVAAASEYDALAVRPGEEALVTKLLHHAPVMVSNPKPSDPHTKVNALLQVRGGGRAGKGRKGQSFLRRVEPLRLLAVTATKALCGTFKPLQRGAGGCWGDAACVQLNLHA